jgi:hypothetical protein
MCCPVLRRKFRLLSIISGRPPGAELYFSSIFWLDREFPRWMIKAAIMAVIAVGFAIESTMLQTTYLVRIASNPFNSSLSLLR